MSSGRFDVVVGGTPVAAWPDDNRTPVCITEVSVLHLDAGHDRNGNPRRTYVLVHPHHGVLIALDEGYEGYKGTGALKIALFGTDGPAYLLRQIVGTFAHRAAERKTMLREFGVSQFRRSFRLVGPNGEE